MVYVDDIVIIRNDNIKTQEFVTHLNHKFFLKDLGKLFYFLGIEVLLSIDHIHLCQ